MWKESSGWGNRGYVSSQQPDFPLCSHCSFSVLLFKSLMHPCKDTQNKHLSQGKWSVLQNLTFLNVLYGISPKCPDVSKWKGYNHPHLLWVTGFKLQPSAWLQVSTCCLTSGPLFIFLHITHLAQLPEELMFPLVTVSPHTDFNGGLLGFANLCLT